MKRADYVFRSQRLAVLSALLPPLYHGLRGGGTATLPDYKPLSIQYP